MQSDPNGNASGKVAAVTPIFLLSAPRSGSTLLQRLLSAHPKIHSIPESWLVPATLAVFSSQPAINALSVRWTRIALDETERHSPGIREAAMLGCGLGLLKAFSSACPYGSVYFLEKTPRNSLVLPELAAAFPTARFVFLWRNPLAIRASMNTTWSKGGWHFRSKADLYEGLAQMIDQRDRLAARACDIRYEALVNNPQGELDAIFEFLGLDTIDVQDAFAAGRGTVEGRLGDPGLKRDSRTSVVSADRDWAQQYGNPFRRAWARRYLAWLGEKRLAKIGCDQAQLLAELSAGRGQTRRMASDLMRVVYAHFNERILFEHWFTGRAGALSRKRVPLD